jgi:hypothetical protein
MKNFLYKIGDFIKDFFTGFTGLFSETSPTSMMRFMSFFMFWFCIYEIHYIVVTYGNDLDYNHMLLIAMLLTFSFFPKVAQKVIEKKYELLEKEAKDKNSMLKS